MRALFSTLQKIVIILIFSVLGLLRDVLRQLRDRTWVGIVASWCREGTPQRRRNGSLYDSLPTPPTSLSSSTRAFVIFEHLSLSLYCPFFFLDFPGEPVRAWKSYPDTRKPLSRAARL